MKDVVANLKELPKEQLYNVGHAVLYWKCCVDGCTAYSRVWDFDMYPEYFWPVGKRGKWMNIQERVMLCHRHFPQYRELHKKGVVNLQMPLEKSAFSQYIRSHKLRKYEK